MTKDPYQIPAVDDPMRETNPRFWLSAKQGTMIAVVVLLMLVGMIALAFFFIWLLGASVP